MFVKTHLAVPFSKDEVRAYFEKQPDSKIKRVVLSQLPPKKKADWVKNYEYIMDNKDKFTKDGYGYEKEVTSKLSEIDVYKPLPDTTFKIDKRTQTLSQWLAELVYRVDLFYDFEQSQGHTAFYSPRQMKMISDLLNQNIVWKQQIGRCLQNLRYTDVSENFPKNRDSLTFLIGLGIRALTHKQNKPSPKQSRLLTILADEVRANKPEHAPSWNSWDNEK